MINNVSGSSTPSLEELKAKMEGLKKAREEAEGAKNDAQANKTGAEGTKSSSEANKTSADSAKTVAETQLTLAKTAVDAAKQSQSLAASNVQVANDEVSGALALLDSAKNAEPVNQDLIDSAQAAYDRAVENQKSAQNALKEANEALDKSKEAQTKAEEALNKATKEAADADVALKAAEESLNKAISELEEAVTALETAEAELVNAENDIKAAEASKPLMSEEQAISEGYTVIHSYEELLKIGNNLSGKYILAGDIEIPEGVNWTPIGSADSPFKGEFNGNGCKITGLNINVTDNEARNVGFFGVTEEAVLKNITFKDAKINGSTDFLTGTTNVGVLAGVIKRSNVENVNVTGDSEVTAYAAAGGLIGAVDDRDVLTGVSSGNSVITNCSTDVDVESMYYAGGLVGYVYGCDSRSEDHRGIVNKSLMIRDCHTSGSATAGEESVGGIIGESDKTLVTLDKCSSDMDLYWSNLEDDSDLSFLLETGRIGGLVGNVNGTYITFANCDFEGSLNGETEFQSEVYGWYMDDSHVCIYDIPAGLPVDDILNIKGIDGMRARDDGKYECTVSTLSGLDKMVAMIKENPSLADNVVFVVNFDFNAMDGKYTYTEYAQYGVVQELYEDENGQVHNDVYIDNECDLESTYHAPEEFKINCEPCECDGPVIAPTMVSGLYVNLEAVSENEDDINYCVLTNDGVKDVNLLINADDQITDVTTRLTQSEVKFRERLVELGKKIQQTMRDILKSMYKWSKDESVPVITKAEYKKLLKKAEKNGFDSLTDKEKLSIAVFEVDYNIMNAQSKYTKNLGCGMGGNASFLDKTTTYQMYDEQGRELYTTLDGDQLIKDENGNYAYADGSGSYYGMAEVFEQRGYQTTDEAGNLLFSDADGNTVTQIKGEDGSLKYVTTDEEGNQVDFEGDVEALERQLTPANYAEDYENFEADMNAILNDVESGKYPMGRLSGKNDDKTAEEVPAEAEGETVEPADDDKKKPDEV